MLKRLSKKKSFLSGVKSFLQGLLGNVLLVIIMIILKWKMMLYRGDDGDDDELAVWIMQCII